MYNFLTVYGTTYYILFIVDELSDEIVCAVNILQFTQTFQRVLSALWGARLM